MNTTRKLPVHGPSGKELLLEITTSGDYDGSPVGHLLDTTVRLVDRLYVDISPFCEWCIDPYTLQSGWHGSLELPDEVVEAMDLYGAMVAMNKPKEMLDDLLAKTFPFTFVS
jgi:hypothetical protein